MNKQKINLITYLLIILFFVFQSSFILEGGTTIDERSIDNSNQITLDKLRMLINFEVFKDGDINPVLKDIYKVETYGQFISFQQFLFSRIFVNSELINSYFNENDLFLSFYSKVNLLRNLYLNIYVSLLLFIIYKVLVKLKSQKFGLIFIIFLILIPSFNGHSQFNQKDIGFMLHIFLASIYIIKLIDSKNKKHILLSALLSGLAVSLRLSGFVILLLPIFYSFLIENNREQLGLSSLVKKYIEYIFYIFIFYIAFSPSSWFNILGFLETSINQQILIQWNGSTLTDGDFILSSNMDKLYLIKWLFYKLPINFHIILILSVFSFKIKNFKKDVFLTFSVIFFLVVNAGFIILTPAAYDGLRQFLFLIPFIVYITTSFLVELGQKLNFVLPVIIIYLIFTQFGLEQYRYVYFNEFVDESSITYDCNNIDGCGNWLTDYWGYSAKSIAEHINNSEINNVYICKSREVWDPYLNEGLNPNYTDTNKISNNSFHLVTIFRPRFQDDGCGFYNADLIYNCKIKKKFVTNLRGNELDLGYLKSCTIEN